MTGSLQVSRGKYYAVINLRDEENNYKQKWVNLNLPAVTGNKRKADKAYREVLLKYEQNRITVYRDDILFCDYIKVWLEDAKPGLEQITYESYQSYIDLHIYPYFRKVNISLSDLEYRHIKGYYSSKSNKLSANSLKKHHVVIKRTLRKAVQSGLISSSPAAEVTLPKAEKFKGSFLSVEQGNTLLEVAKDTPMEPVVILGMMYGLRRSEIAGLKWSAIDLENDTLTVQHTVTKFKSEIAKDRTKNKASNRILPLNSEIKNYLQKLQAQQLQDRLFLGGAYQDTEYICRWPDGRPLKCDYLSRAFKNLLAKHELPSIRLHDLRHSCASYMLKMGCSMKEVADWLGHADIKTSMNVYAHLDIEAKKSVADRFSSILSI